MWQRRWIRFPDGREDATTTVLWLQASRFYADIRLPADRPDFTGVHSLAELSESQRRYLASQEGFAGELVLHPEGWLWQRHVDFRPPTAARDIGRLRYLDPEHRTLLEEGVDAPYTELWERVAPGTSPRVLRAPNDSPAPGYLVAVGPRLLLAVDHRPTHADPFNMELSLGTRTGAIDQWIIERSTHPWREGQPLPPLHTWDVLE